MISAPHSPVERDAFAQLMARKDAVIETYEQISARWQDMFVQAIAERDLARARAFLHSGCGFVAGVQVVLAIAWWQESVIGALLLLTFAVLAYLLPFMAAALDIKSPHGRASSAQEPPSSMPSTAPAAPVMPGEAA